MRRKDKKIDDPKIIDDILTKSSICSIAFFDTEYPYVVPMNFGYHKNSLYLHCATRGKKIDLINKNNKVGFEIVQTHKVIKSERSCDWTTHYRSILGTGEIDIITATAEKQKGLDILMKQHGKNDNSYDEKSLKRVVVLKLTINSLSAKQSGDW